MGGGVRLHRSLQQRTGSLNIRSILWIKENQISQVKELALFCVWGYARVWAHWNHFFHMHLSYLGPASCVLHILSSSVLIVGSSYSLMAASLHKYSSSWMLLGLRNSHLEDWNGWWMWNPCLQIWQEILHFSELCLIHLLSPFRVHND